MALNFGLLDTSIPERLGAMPANALAMRRQRLMQDEQIAGQREQQQMQNALAQMQMRKAQGEMEQDQAYRNALRQAPAGDWNAVLPEIRKVAPDRAMALEKQLGEMQKGKAETRAKMSDVAHKKLGMYREMLVNVNTPQQFAQWLTAQHSDQDLQELMGSLPSLEDSLATIPQDPREFEQMKIKSAVGIGKFMEMNKPDIQSVDLGGSRQFVQINPMTGEVRQTGPSMGKTMSPGEIAADARARASLSQSERQFQATQGLQRERLDMERTKSAAQPSAPAQKASDAREVLQLLDQAGPLVDQATGSYIGAGIDIVGRGAGISTQGAQAGAQLRAIEGMLISKMPKMSGPQSDKDVLLYKQMAGQIGDPTIPAAQKKSAMSAIRQINERYAVQPATRSNASATNARGWALHTDANGNQAYVSPDGTQFEELR